MYPSAISGLLQRLQGGLQAPQGAFQLSPEEAQGQYTPPAPMAALAPAPPPAPAPRGNILDRITGGIGHLIGSDRVDPQIASLLNPAEVAQAQPGLVRSLLGIVGGMAPSDLATARAKDIVGEKQGADAVRMSQQAAGDLARFRAKYNPQLDAAKTEDDRYNILSQMAVDAFRLGLPISEHIGAVLNAMRARNPQLSAHVVGKNLVDNNGNVLYTDTSKKDGTPSWFKMPAGSPEPYRAIYPGEDVPQGAVPVQTERTNITVAGANDRAANSLTERRVKDFNTSVKPAADRLKIINQALRTLSDAADTSDPVRQRALYSSAITNFVQAADQKAQVRWQLLNFFKSNIDPSFSGKWDVLTSRIANGTIPPATMRAMISHLQGLKQMEANDIATKRAGLVSRHPSLDSELPDESEFGADMGAAPDAPVAKSMSRATYNALSPAEQKQALASGYVVK